MHWGSETKIRYSIAATFLLLLAFFSFKPLDEPVDRIVEAITRFSTENPQEKVFIHTDKPFYAAGDTIWYKGYAVDAIANHPSNRSEVLYVDLVNDQDSTIVSQKVRMVYGSGNAQINLPINMAPGIYTLVSYTNWMRNFDQAFFFNRKIQVINAFDTRPGTAPVAAPPDVQFFPEGGYLVAGIRSVVGFKAIGANGRAVNIAGHIVDEDNNKLLDFESAHAGMGVFALSPEAGKQYTAITADASGKELRYPLPVARSSGYVLSVTHTDHERLGIKLVTSTEFISQDELIVLVQQNNEAKYATRIKAQQLNNVQVPKSKLQTGIAQVTVFKGTDPLVQRVVFIRSGKFVTPELAFGTSRGETELNIAMQLDGKPLSGSYSLAVTDADKVIYDDLSQDNILTNLLLTSDLKGQVEAPWYYFEEDNETRRRHLDHLMLTQGWTRFDWKNIIAGKFPEIKYQAEKGLAISGTITTLGGQPLPRAKATLLSSRGTFFSTDTITDDKGRFRFDQMGFPDSTVFVIQGNKENGKRSVRAVFDREAVAKHKSEPFLYWAAAPEQYTANSLLQYRATYDANRERMLQIEAIEIKAQKKPVIPNSTNLNGPGRADQVFVASQLESAVSLITFIKNNVGGVQNYNNFIHFTRSGYLLFGEPRPIQFTVDGMEVEQDFVENINVNDVAGIEILKSAAYSGIYGLNALGGTIVITMKRGIPNREVSTPGLALFTPKGFTTGRKFYVPKYNTTSDRNAHRTTIFWEPNIITNKEGTAKLKFTHPDRPGKYKLIIQGIDIEGNAVYGMRSYKVD